MPTFNDHCLKSQQILGESFPEVHLWLDEFFGKPSYGSRHRYLRHHQEGIEEVKAKWGDRAAMAAEMHIRQDLESEGWPPDMPIPENSHTYRKAGLW